MKKIIKWGVVLAALLVAVLASGCTSRVSGAAVNSTGNAPALPSVSTTPTKAPVKDPTPVANERGMYVKKLGEKACFGGGPSTCTTEGIVFSVDRIQVDPKCYPYGGDRKGHTLLLSVRAATGTDTAAIQEAPVVFSSYAFKTVDKEGVTQNVDWGMCTEKGNSAPDTYAPHSKYRFQIEVDAPIAHGGLMLQPGNMGDDLSGGWEWQF